jgi:Pyruvate/2-oxoacid:ferredoxin oxidoreductase delta subunit
VDAFLRGESYVPTPTRELASFDRLNTWYYGDAPQMVQSQLDLLRRAVSFAEVTKGLDETNALFEARRCLSCGNCFECDNCYGVCPDNAVVKLGPGKRFRINYDYCKDCGICAAECPCGAIEMIPRPANAWRPMEAARNRAVSDTCSAHAPISRNQYAIR